MSDPVLANPAATRTGAVVAVLAFTGIVVSLMQTLVIPIIPKLPEYLDAEAADTAWVITATLLAAAVATPVVGRLGDMFGKRRLLLVSVALMVVGSVMGALSTDVLPMIVARTLQGMAAGVIPLGISMMRDILPRERLAGAVAMMSASLGIGGAFGLPIAAVIAEYANWHALFWISAVLGVAAGIAVLVVVPESEVRSGGGFDAVGAFTMAAGLVSMLLAVSKGASWGWTDVKTTGASAIAACMFTVWGWWELRTPQPLVDLRVASRRQVLLTNIASIVFGFAMFASTMVFPQIVQLPEQTGFGLGGSMVAAGLVMAPFGAMLLLAAPLSSSITNNYGPRATLMIGSLVVAAGYAAGIFMLHSIWQLIVTGLMIGFGTGLAYGAMPALIMSAVPSSQTGSANSFNTLMRSLGTSFASAIAGVVLAQMTISLGGAAIPSEGAFRVVMAIASGASLVAFVVALFIPRSPVVIEEQLAVMTAASSSHRTDLVRG